MKKRIDGTYGVDAPYVPAVFFIVAGLLLLYGILSPENIAWGLVLAVFFGAQGFIYLNTTLRGKFAIWNQILGDVELPKNARILDAGCGRGMAVITALRDFSTARGVGLDLWRGQDQSGNDPAATIANAELNGVQDRLELVTEDMCSMSAADGTYDLVISNVAIQNIKNREHRREAIEEIYRVTKPGGQIRIVDIQYVHQYEEDLEQLGAADVWVRQTGVNGWYGNPFYASKLVTASKPPVAQ